MPSRFHISVGIPQSEDWWRKSNSTTNEIELKNISVTQVVFPLKAGLSQVGTTCDTLRHDFSG
ncbi:MAG: hypothetical protein WBD28_05160 [Candidatus Zixiibacteriota bacterium]